MSSIHHVLTILAVEDLARSAAFYESGFGWRRIVDAPVYVEFEVPGGMRLGLYERHGFGRNVGQVPSQAPPGDLAPTELYFYTSPDELDVAIQRITGAGARLLSARTARDWGDEATYFADPDGNVIVLACPLDGEVTGPDRT
jgi:catechol 2,3-dioxygenase-like lactoylglutathione lyase family enzyme